MEYKQIIIGGTFDRMHVGHKAFLRFAFEKGDSVLIGLTTNEYVAKEKNDTNILSFDERRKELELFLKSEGFLSRAKIVAINNRYDQTQVPEKDSTALLVSSETYESGLAINKERERNNLEPLPLLVVPIVLSSTGEKISSTAIRSGLFDRNGNITFSANEQIKIPDMLRNTFHKPFGTLFMRDIPEKVFIDPERLVIVGDVTTKRVHDLHVNPKISVIDFRIERKDTHSTITDLGFTGTEKIIKLQNSAGTIAPQVWGTVADIVKNIQQKEAFILIVNGEEDLLVIPLILLLPVGYTVLYGQPGEGVVQVIVSEEKKHQILQFLRHYL